MLENIKLCGYGVPTPVQAYCIPAVLQDRDVIAVAQTGKSPTRKSEGDADVITQRFWEDCSLPNSYVV